MYKLPYIHTYMYIYIYTYTDRQTDIHTDRQTDRETNRHTLIGDGWSPFVFTENVDGREAFDA